MSEVSFDPTLLISHACEQAGLTNLGSDDFREPLRVLCETYDSNPYDEKARRRNRRRVLGLLATRLRIEEAMRLHPEIAARPLPKPMVLTGLPRSGTSALFNLLAADPAARPLLLWETQFPDPAIDLEPGAEDPRYLAVKRYYEAAHEKNPEFTKIHFASADTPEECVLLHAYSLNGVHHGVEVMIEPYASWYREQDLGPMYAYYRSLLQMIDWQRPGDRWLLKAPAHMWAIEALIETFPDVSIVWSHRDPLLCTASICSMTENLTHGLDLPKEKLGPIVMDFYATSLERGLAARDRSEAARFVDVMHDEFVEDSMSTAKRIHDHFGLSLEGAAKQGLEDHIAANPKGKHGEHSYSLEEFGLDPDRVKERFSDYIRRFDIEVG